LASPPERLVSAWADAERVLGPEEGPFPGRWRTDRVPYLRDVMDALSLAHPARRVTLMASAQVGKTMALLNLAGQVIAETPTTVLWVLPSLDEAQKFNRDKLEPMLANSPAVSAKVKALVSRDETGSTTKRKNFPGGNIDLTGANSSKGLQMVTKRVILLDEVSEFPMDVDGRGDPVAMAEARAIAWTGREKIAAASTPGIKGQCRISARFEDGSQGRFHVACPDCSAKQPLVFENLRWPKGEPSAALKMAARVGSMWPVQTAAQSSRWCLRICAGPRVNQAPLYITAPHAVQGLSIATRPPCWPPVNGCMSGRNFWCITPASR
jgi:phage terminase large subunit GpA-like protein